VFALTVTSCEDWLDVNTDPDSPNNESALVSNRLPWIQKFWLYSAGVTNMRTSCIAGLYYSNNATNYTLSVSWACAAGATTTSYQTWFVGVAPNLTDLYNKAQAEGAYHYMAAANVFHAMGFMQMLDLYGEMPYTEALGSSPSPAFDDGKTIYHGCIDKIDEAIELFGKTQESTATRLSEGDIWNNGNVDKWIKFCYGLKARYLLRLSKKTDLFDVDAILSCLEKAPQSNLDNIVSPCYNSSSDVTDYLWGDPIMTNGNWAYAAYGNNQRISQYYYNLLTNMRESGVEDPRMTKIVPSTMSNIKLDASGKVQSYDWVRSKGVDFYGESTRLTAGGGTSITLPTYADADKDVEYEIKDEAKRTAFIASIEGKYAYSLSGDNVKVTYKKGAVYVNNGNYILAGDTVYVNLRSNSCLTGNSSLGEGDVNWYYSTPSMTAGAVGSTGSFQVRPISDQEVLTYHEMCFIKAEMYMRKGNKDLAFTAYKEGIKAHLDFMQAKLTEWKAAGYNNPDMWPMDENQMNTYLTSTAVCQNSSNLTMSDIMLQKYVAMGCSIENWNDMRRFNFSTGNIDDFGIVYPGYDRSPLFAGQAQVTGSTKTDPTYWIRRYRLPATLELNYNSTNANLINSKAGEANIWCYPVWWDCATDDEYYGYIK
jgi:tetratricopeptide (TPR) repeat protein